MSKLFYPLPTPTWCRKGDLPQMWLGMVYLLGWGTSQGQKTGLGKLGTFNG